MIDIDKKADLFGLEEDDGFAVMNADKRDGFKAGAEWMHAELTRWHDPKEKLPPPRQVALLKLKDADDEVYYRVGIFLDCRQFQFIGYRLGSEVLGWRYIHE